VIDDDPAFQELIRLLLETEGHTVLSHPSALNAVERVISEHPDLVILDIMMPGATGWEILNRLKAQRDTADIPILVCSAAVPDIVKARGGLQILNVEALLKPFEVDELFAKISVALKKHEPNRPGLSTGRSSP
jgi:CheY-like chemotaxis protein